MKTLSLIGEVDFLSFLALYLHTRTARFSILTPTEREGEQVTNICQFRHSFSSVCRNQQELRSLTQTGLFNI